MISGQQKLSHFFGPDEYTQIGMQTAFLRTAVPRKNPMLPRKNIYFIRNVKKKHAPVDAEQQKRTAYTNKLKI